MSDNNIVTAGAEQQQGGLTLVAAFLAATDTKKAGADLASLLQAGSGAEIKQALELTANAGRRAAEILSASTGVLVGKELSEEFREIDENTKAEIVGELRKELKAIDAEWGPKIMEEAQAKAMEQLKAAAKAFDEAARLCMSLGAMSSTMSAPSGDLIGVATSSVMSSGQPAPSTALTGVAAEVATPSTAALGV